VYALRNILCVPSDVRDWIRLNHYEGLNFSLDSEAPNIESITLQRKKLRETQKLRSLLMAETARNQATITALKGLLSDQLLRSDSVDDLQHTSNTFGFLHRTGNLTGDVSHPISTTTLFALSQLPALKSLLQDLKPRLGELANREGKQSLIGEEEKSWRRERLEFIERETRRHLENVRGLELGDMGEVRDGEWQAEGRKLGKGEVEDLERVAGLLGADDQSV
jgi:kinetochore protein Mis12/MTW1